MQGSAIKRPSIWFCFSSRRRHTRFGCDLSSDVCSSDLSLNVPLMDTTIYLDYLVNRFQKAGGSINANVRFEKLEDVDPKFNLVINCAGIGARGLVHDIDLEPHRGQVAIVPKIDNLKCGIVCDAAPLM